MKEEKKIRNSKVWTFKAKKWRWAGHCAHAVGSLAGVSAETAGAILARDDAVNVTRLELSPVLVPLQGRLRNSYHLEPTNAFSFEIKQIFYCLVGEGNRPHFINLGENRKRCGDVMIHQAVWSSATRSLCLAEAEKHWSYIFLVKPVAGFLPQSVSFLYKSALLKASILKFLPNPLHNILLFKEL